MLLLLVRASYPGSKTQLYLVQNFRHSFEMERYIPLHIQRSILLTREAIYITRRSCKQKHLRRHIDYGGGNGAAKEGSTLQAPSFGRYENVSFTAQLESELDIQINDCWPVTSWAIVDYFQRPKPAYFAIARELQSYTVGITRKEYQWFSDDRSAADFVIKTELQIWGTNSTLSQKHATLSVTCFDLYSDWRHVWEDDIVLAVNSSTELYKGPLPGQPERMKWSELPKVIIASARILDKSKAVLARHSNWCVGPIQADSETEWTSIELGRSRTSSSNFLPLKNWDSSLSSRTTGKQLHSKPASPSKDWCWMWMEMRSSGVIRPLTWFRTTRSVFAP